MKTKVVTGPSINSENFIGHDASNPAEKLPLDRSYIGLGGSSANIATAIEKLGHESLLFAATGAARSKKDNDVLLEQALSKTRLKVVRLPILVESNVAYYVYDTAKRNNRIIGKTFSVIKKRVPNAIKKMLAHLSDDYVWAIASGITSEHEKIVYTLFKDREGCRVLSPKKELLKLENRAALDRLLKVTDMFILNEEEWTDLGLTMETIHALGPRLVIVTKEAKGGTCSLDGHILNYPAVQFNAPEDPVYTVGTGDWFTAAFVVSLIDQITSIEFLDKRSLRIATHFAALVSGKKVTMDGASNGPTKEDIPQLLSFIDGRKSVRKAS